MRRYIIRSTKTGNELELRYTELGLLVYMEMRGSFTEQQWLLITSRIGMRYEPGVFNDLRALKLEVVELKWTFQEFIDSYGINRNVLRAQKAWFTLTETEKGAAMAGIFCHRTDADRRRIAMKYPDTYLRNKSWQDYRTNLPAHTHEVPQA